MWIYFVIKVPSTTLQVTQYMSFKQLMYHMYNVNQVHVHGRVPFTNQAMSPIIDSRNSLIYCTFEKVLSLYARLRCDQRYSYTSDCLRGFLNTWI